MARCLTSSFSIYHLGFEILVVALQALLLACELCVGELEGRIAQFEILNFEVLGFDDCIFLRKAVAEV